MNADVHAQFEWLEEIRRGKGGVHCSYQSRNTLSKLSQPYQVHHTHGRISGTLCVEQLCVWGWAT